MPTPVDDEMRGGSGSNGAMLNRDWLARIDGKLDRVLDEQSSQKTELALAKARITELEKDDKDREARVGKLEGRFGNVLTGIGAGIFAAALYFFQDLRGGG